MIKKIHRKQTLPITLDEAWDFFATPKNLNKVTPSDLSFKILSDIPDKMYEGLLIRYIIKPMINIPIHWCTEITHIKEKKYFVDEQRQGPYKMWHHEHHFSTILEGVLMEDILHYDIGKSILGRIAGSLFIDKQVETIFDYRKESLDAYFNKP